MPRGKKVDIEDYIANIEEYLKVGCSIHEACLNGEVPYRTVMDYYENDEEIRKKIDRLKKHSIYIARKSVFDHMAKDGKLALSFLERKKKDEFSLKSEIAHSGEIEQKHTLDVTKLTDDQLKALRDAMVSDDTQG